METEGSLPRLQELATCPYSGPDHSSPCPPSHFLNIHCTILLPSKPVPSKSFFRSDFHIKPLYTHLLSPIPATCPAPLSILDLITRIIFGVEYRSLSSSIRSLLHSLVSSSPLGLNILLSTLFSNTYIFSLSPPPLKKKTYKRKLKLKTLITFETRSLTSCCQ